MSQNKYLTSEEVSQRYRGEISVGTLRNWRTQGIGFSFVKIGKAVLYPIDELDAWDKAHTVICGTPRRNGEHATRQRDGEGEGANVGTASSADL